LPAALLTTQAERRVKETRLVRSGDIAYEDCQNTSRVRQSKLGVHLQIRLPAVANEQELPFWEITEDGLQCPLLPFRNWLKNAL
jgi:hypothetical protein